MLNETIRRGVSYKRYTQENSAQKQVLKRGGEKYVLVYRRKTGEEEGWGRINFQMAVYLLIRNLRIVSKFLVSYFSA